MSWGECPQFHDAGRVLFFDRRICKNELLGHYYGSMVYEIVLANPAKSKVYGEGVMGGTVPYFEKWAIKLKDKVTDNKGVYHGAWIVPVHFCVLRYINDARYLLKDGTHRMLKTCSVREPNFKFVQMIFVDTARDVNSHKVIAVQKFRSINNGENFFLYYGEAYNFKQ